MFPVFFDTYLDFMIPINWLLKLIFHLQHMQYLHHACLDHMLMLMLVKLKVVAILTSIMAQWF